MRVVCVLGSLLLKRQTTSLTFAIGGAHFARGMSSLSAYKRFLHDKAYIDGQWRPSLSGAQFDVLNPATGEVIGKAAECNIDDARAAVAAAQKAFPAWSMTTAKERAQLLQKLYKLQLDNNEALAQLITVEMGKPLKESRGEIGYGASFLEWFAEEARRINGAILQSPWKDKRLSYHKEPCGVVGIITPVNIFITLIYHFIFSISFVVELSQRDDHSKVGCCTRCWLHSCD